MTDRSKDDYEKPWGTGGVKREREREKIEKGEERRRRKKRRKLARL